MNPTNDVRNRLRKTNEYLNLTTQFKCEGTVNKPEFYNTACFAKALKTHYKDMDNTYYIQVFKARQEGLDNLMMFTEEEVEKYFNYIEEVVGPFEWSFTDDPENPEKYYLITIHINGPHFIHTFIITSVRYLYEKSYAIMLNEAMMLKNTYRFRKENIYTLLALVIDSNPWLANNCSRDMSHFNNRAILELLSTDTLKTRIEEYSKCNYFKISQYGTRYYGMKSITSLFMHKEYSLGDPSLGLNYVDIYKNNTNGEHVLDEDFRKRYIKYRHNYKIINKLPNASIQKEIALRGPFYDREEQTTFEGTDKNVLAETIDNYKFDSFYKENGDY